MKPISLSKVISSIAISLLCCNVYPDVHNCIFKEYDIRGKVDIEFNMHDIYEIAQAIGSYFIEQNPNVKTVAIGMDGRIHSQAIKEQICDALQEAGFNIIFIGMCTTPILYFSLHNLEVDAGLMITASHNPAEYNGIKICLGKEPVYGMQIKKIKEIYKSKQYLKSAVRGNYQEHDLITPYINWLVTHFSHLIGMDMHVIIDCGNGAAGTVLPMLIEKMKWRNMQLLYPEIDGTYPHHIADPSVELYMQDLKNKIFETQASLGIGLDGDCDRMAPMTQSGHLILGDKLLAIFTQSMMLQHPNMKVIFDVSSSKSMLDLLASWGAQPMLSKTGHAHVKTLMKQHDAFLGGEMSCHFTFKDRYFGFDDGIYAMIRLFEILHQNKTTLDELVADFPHVVSSITYRIPCKPEDRSLLIEELKELFSSRTDVQLIAIDGVRIHFNNGWAIIRSSNTEPVLSIRCEGNTQKDLDAIKQEFIPTLSKYIDCAFLML